MKFLNIALGVGIGILLLSGSILRENQLFEVKKVLNNPFENHEILDTQKSISGIKFKDFILSSGGFVRAYEDSSLDFSDGKNEIFSGNVFLSGGLKIPEQKEFVKIFNLYIDIGESSVFVSIDKQRRSLELFSINGNLNIYTSKDSDPIFLIPPRHMISPKIEQGNVVVDYKDPYTHYFTQKKEWKLALWENHEKALQIEGLHRIYTDWVQGFRPYSLNFIKAWSNGTSTGIITKVFEKYRDIQAHFALGFPEKKRERFIFGTFLNPISDGIKAVQKDDLFSAKNLFLSFHETSNTPEWESFLEKNAPLKTYWRYFEWSQKTWLAKLSPSLEKEAFSKLWIAPAQKTKGSELDKDIEKMTFFLVENKFEKARAVLEKISENLKKWRSSNDPLKKLFSETEAPILTKARRVLGSILLTTENLQTKEAFKLYEDLTLHEKALYSETALIEKQIEISQETFLLIKIFIETQSEKSVSDILIRLWKEQEIDSIEKQIGQKIFSDEEKELVNFIRIASSTALSEEEITQIKEAELLERDFEKKIQDLAEQNSAKEEAPKDTTIKNPKDFLEFLNSKNIEVNLQNFKTNRETETSFFSKAKFYDERLSGEFDYTSQRFLQFVVNQSTSYDRIHKSFLDKILAKLEAKYKTVEEQKKEDEAEELIDTEFSEVQTTVLQNTEKVILTRRFIQNLLANYGLVLDRKNIFALDEELKTFEVIFSEIFDIKSLRFTYDKIERTFSNIKGKYLLKEIKADKENEIASRRESEEIIRIPGPFIWEELKPLLHKEINRLETQHLNEEEGLDPEEESILEGDTAE